MASVPAAAPAPALPVFKLPRFLQKLTSPFAVRDGATKGILLIITATVFFALSDISAKYLTDTLGVVQISWIRYAVFCALVLPAAVIHGGTRVFYTARPGLQAIRGLCMVLSTLLFILGLAYLNVADATAINFVSPVFITALAVPLLGEKVGLRRWLAAGIGLMGVLIIVQPGSSAFQLAALLPVAAAAVWALAAITTRKMNATESPQTTLLYSALSGFALLTVLVPFDWRMPNATEIGIGILIGILSTVAHGLFVLAYRHANASALAPFSYVQIIWASLLGFIVLGTVPGIWTYVGAGVIAVSGLYTAHRERLKARNANAQHDGIEAEVSPQDPARVASASA